jgi:hypothetical protein
MTYINEGITSAKRQTWEYGHREVLRRIVKANPAKSDPPSEADEAKWRRLYREDIQADEDLVLACIDYCFHADLRALLDNRFAGKNGERDAREKPQRARPPQCATRPRQKRKRNASGPNSKT